MSDKPKWRERHRNTRVAPVIRTVKLDGTLWEKHQILLDAIKIELLIKQQRVEQKQDRAKEFIRLRGLGYTLQAIADLQRPPLTRERVRQIISKYEKI